MIYISDRYKIDADKYQYILLTAREGKEKVEGKMVDVIKWDKTYFPSIGQCARSIANNELRQAIEQEIVNNLKDCTALLQSFIEEVENLHSETIILPKKRFEQLIDIEFLMKFIDENWPDTIEHAEDLLNQRKEES